MNVEEAIKLAKETVVRLFGGEDHRLEEVEIKDDNGFDVTISYLAAGAPTRLVPLGTETATSAIWGGKRAAIGIDPARTYKDVQVSKDGQVKAVHMRQIVVG